MIHTVGPVWQGGDAGEDGLLAACYRSSLELAAANGCASIAFPAISTGVFGFPPGRAAPIAVRTVFNFTAEDEATGIERVIFACFGADSAALHRAAIAALPDS